jgi:nucleotide-binding universal stress UspA family protein
MGFADILVQIRPHETWSEHVDAAGRLAKRFGARLTGLYTSRDIAVLKVAYNRDHPSIRERQKEEDAAAAAAGEKFRAQMEAIGVACDFQVGEGDASDLVTLLAKLHDLVVVPQTDREHDEGGWDVAEQSVLATGRPTLIVPRKGSFASIGRRILVAWNESRESALALHAAAPFYANSELVRVLVGPAKETFFRFMTKAPRVDVGAFLQRRAPKVEVKPFTPSDSEAGRAILAEAKAMNADLVVMGAYGRTRFSEWILGGATRQVLHDAEVPVLMAH